MQLYLLSILIFCLQASFHFTTASAQSTIKKIINVTVRDAATGKAIEGAEVIYRGLLSKQNKNTDSEGRVTFEIKLLTSMLNATIEANDGRTFSAYRPFKTTVTLKDDQEVYDVQVFLKSDYKAVLVTAIDEETRQPVSNAKVTLRGVKDFRDDINYTGGSGDATFEVLMIDPKTVPVTIEKEGYEPFTTSFNLNRNDSRYSVSGTLKKDKKIKWLKVKVVANDDGSPVIGSTVTALGKTLHDTYSADTDQNGEASVALRSGGEMEVSARHDAFRMGKQPLNVNYYGDQNEYTMSFRLERKGDPPGKRYLVVYVYTKGKNGELMPLSGADVRLGGKGMLTMNMPETPSLNGWARLEQTGLGLGDQAAVTVSHPDYETQTKTFVVGGDKWSEIPKHDQLDFILEKPGDKKLNLTVRVLDADKNTNVLDAVVVVKDYSGNVVSNAGSAGNTKLKIGFQDLRKNLRVIVSAPQYEEKWSDLPAEFKQETTEEKFYTVYLKRKAAAKQGEEKKYGPFTVTPGQWTSTGLRLKKGQAFRVEASGILQYKDPPNIKNTPDGGGAWGWWQLKAKINDQLIGVGSKGGGMAEKDGMIELGAPATYRMGHPEEKALEGSYMVYVFSKDAVEDKNPANNPALAEKNKKAKNDLEFLHELLKGKQIPHKDPEQISQEVKRIALEYDLPGYATNKQLQFELMGCIRIIKIFHEYFYNRMGSPTQEEHTKYTTCIASMSYLLDLRIKGTEQ